MNTGHSTVVVPRITRTFHKKVRTGCATCKYVTQRQAPGDRGFTPFRLVTSHEFMYLVFNRPTEHVESVATRRNLHVTVAYPRAALATDTRQLHLGRKGRDPRLPSIVSPHMTVGPCHRRLGAGRPRHPPQLLSALHMS